MGKEKCKCENSSFNKDIGGCICDDCNNRTYNIINSIKPIKTGGNQKQRMKIKKLKEIIKDLSDEMPVGLFDLTTDDFYDCNYPLSESNMEIMDYVKDEGGEVEGKMLFICFKNKLNDNPI